MRQCERCVLNDSIPGVKISEEGLCNLCTRTPEVDVLRKKRNDLEKKLQEELTPSEDLNYDVVVAYSGGKDSSYTLYYVTEVLKLKALAVTIDNGYIAEQARKNAFSLTDALGVDFMWYKPDPKFMKGLYKESVINSDKLRVKSAITRASDMCNSCIGLINHAMINIALEKDIPFIAGGYIGGQVPKDSALVDLSLVSVVERGKRIKTYRELFGHDSEKFFTTKNKLIQNYSYPKIRIVNPMLSLNISEDDIISKISDFGWIKPTTTGTNSSNCLLNDVGIRIHQEKYGFNPYSMEIAEQVRYGLMSRQDGLKKMEVLIKDENYYKELKNLNIELN